MCELVSCPFFFFFRIHLDITIPPAGGSNNGQKVPPLTRRLHGTNSRDYYFTIRVYVGIDRMVMNMDPFHSVRANEPILYQVYLSLRYSPITSHQLK